MIFVDGFKIDDPPFFDPSKTWLSLTQFDNWESRHTLLSCSVEDEEKLKVGVKAEFNRDCKMHVSP